MYRADVANPEEIRSLFAHLTKTVMQKLLLIELDCSNPQTSSGDS